MLGGDGLGVTLIYIEFHEPDKKRATPVDDSVFFAHHPVLVDGGAV